MEDLKYPIWAVTAKFDEIAYKNNSMSFRVSFREEKTKQDIEDYTKGWWEKILANKKNEGKGFVLQEFVIKLVDTETWYLEWFCHTSLTRYDNESDAFNSFKRFLLRKGVSMNYGEFGSSFSSRDGDYMPMGADDIFRWEYCRCDSCIKKGITIISH